MMSKTRKRWGLASVAAWAVLVANTATAQPAAVDRFFLPTGTADYASGGNWTGGFVPEATFNERAIINDGGTAVLTSTALAPSAVILGQGVDDSGTPHRGELEIGSGGNLPVVFLTGNLGLGTVTVGAGGTGELRVLPGGTLNADRALVSGANAANTIVLGGTGAGTATVNVGSASFGGTTQVFRNADFNSAGSITFQPSSVYNIEITAAGSPTLNSAFSATLGGTLNVSFSGVSPALGSTYDLFDAGGFGGAFAEINTTGAPALDPGLRYAVNFLPEPLRRVRGVLQVERFLQLNVDRDSGAVSIANDGNLAFGIQGYTINSVAGSLSVGGWNSLDAQNALGGDWRESNPSATRLSELKPSGASNLGGASGVSLGDAYAPDSTEFGIEIDDLAFQYVKSDGSVANGIVNYTGTPNPNNLLLTVDPTSGAAQLKNTSPHEVSIDGYTISSLSGSLSTTGWDSLDDQNAAGGDWRESNASANRLSELTPIAAATLTGGMNFDLGNLFSVGGDQDLIFGFVRAGESNAFLGVVTYGPIAAGVAGDYNNDGVVNAADYTVWRDRLGAATLENRGDGIVGAVSQADYNFWKSRFGATSGSGSAAGHGAAVPEPQSLAMAALALLAGVVSSRRRSLGGGLFM